ncbi:MAG TPA: SMP-30/gluconolactonase/LRE family protein [Longimicrobiales bacterium]
MSALQRLMLVVAPATWLTGCDSTELVTRPAPALSSSMAQAFDNVMLDESPEGVAIDNAGSTYVALSSSTRIVRIDASGSTSDVARLLSTSIPADGPPGLLGLALHRGQLYAALVTFDPATHGVWRIPLDGSPAERIAGTEAICWPNALAFDPQGNLYVTESTRNVPPCTNPPAPVGAIWRIDRRSHDVALWLEDPLLAGNGFLASLGFPIPPLGANGIVYDRGSIYIANTEQGSVVGIPIRPDGGPGSAQVIASGPDMLPLDGLTVDPRGYLFALAIGNHAVVRVDPRTGERVTVASFAAGDPLDYPINAAFGRGRLDPRSLYVVNSALFEPGPAGPGEPRPGAGIVRIDIDASGGPSH